MTGISGCVERKSDCWILLGQPEEGGAHVRQVQSCDIAVNQIRHVEPDFVEAKPFTTPVPREGAQEGIKLFRGISESCEVLAQDDDHVRTNLFRVCDQL